MRYVLAIAMTAALAQGAAGPVAAAKKHPQSALAGRWGALFPWLRDWTSRPDTSLSAR